MFRVSPNLTPCNPRTKRGFVLKYFTNVLQFFPYWAMCVTYLGSGPIILEEHVNFTLGSQCPAVVTLTGLSWKLIPNSSVWVCRNKCGTCWNVFFVHLATRPASLRAFAWGLVAPFACLHTYVSSVEFSPAPAGVTSLCSNSKRRAAAQP